MADFRLIIAGGRDFNDYGLLKQKADVALSNKIKEGANIIIISGAAKGADRLGERYAIERGFAIERYPADWKRYGKSAGPRRNEEMAKVADGLLAFWNGQSRGTRSMIDLAAKYGVRTIVIRY